MERLGKRPSPALVLSFITLLLALTSSAGALSGKGKVQRGDLAKNSVTARALAAGAVKSRALAKKSVTSKKLANDSVTQAKLAHFAVGAASLGDTTVVTAPIPDTDPTKNGCPQLPPPPPCLEAGEPCTVDSDCCSGHCLRSHQYCWDT